VNLAGQGSKIGGAVASALGWIVHAGGLSIAHAIRLIAQAHIPTGFAGYALGIPIAVLSVVIGIVLLRGGKSLNASGNLAERGARVQAIFALASHRGGALTALDVAQSLSISVEEADLLLTSLAKEQYERVAVEIDPSGGLYYRFVVPGAVDRGDASAARVRVDPEVARSPNRAQWEKLEAQAAAEAEAVRPAERMRRGR
jgi:hypothetical protein